MFEIFIIKLIVGIAVLSVAIRIVFIEAESIAAAFTRARNIFVSKRDAGTRPSER
jgi:hypothetical protein